jgi:hypothetical protein
VKVAEELFPTGYKEEITFLAVVGICVADGVGGFHGVFLQSPTAVHARIRLLVKWKSP